MNQNDNQKQTQTKRYCIIVPQHFVQVFHVDAKAPDEAVDLVRSSRQSPEEDDANVSWSDSDFIEDLEETHWWKRSLKNEPEMHRK